MKFEYRHDQTERDAYEDRQGQKIERWGNDNVIFIQTDKDRAERQTRQRQAKQMQTEIQPDINHDKDREKSDYNS